MSTFLKDILQSIYTSSVTRDEVSQRIIHELRDVSMIDDIFIDEFTKSLFDCQERHRDFLRRSSKNNSFDGEEEEDGDELETENLWNDKDGDQDDFNSNKETKKSPFRFHYDHISISSGSSQGCFDESDQQNDMNEDLEQMYISSKCPPNPDKDVDNATMNLAFEFNAASLNPSQSEEEEVTCTHSENVPKTSDDRPIDQSKHENKERIFTANNGKDADASFVSCNDGTIGVDEFHDALGAIPDISVEYPSDSSDTNSSKKSDVAPDPSATDRSSTFVLDDNTQPTFHFGASSEKSEKSSQRASVRNVFNSTTRSPTFIEAKSIFEAKTSPLPNQKNTSATNASGTSTFYSGFSSGSDQQAKCLMCMGIIKSCPACQVRKVISSPDSSISTKPFHIGTLTKDGKKRSSPRRSKLKSKSFNASFESCIPEPRSNDAKTPSVDGPSDVAPSPTEYMDLDTPIGNVGVSPFTIGKAINTNDRKNGSGWKSTKSKLQLSSKKAPFAQMNDKPSLETTGRERMIKLREEGKILYKNQDYIESILKYTESIGVLTKNFTYVPNPITEPEQSDSLAALLGNRAAGLMMIGAYKTAYEDCEKALRSLNDFNPVGLNMNDNNIIAIAFKPDGGVTLMVKLLARLGRAMLKCGLIDDAEYAFDKTIRIVNSVLSFHEKIRLHCVQHGLHFPLDLQGQCAKVLEQSLTDSSLNKSDILRVRELITNIQADEGLKRSVDRPTARRQNPKLLPAIHSILQITPADEAMQEMKVICLASAKRWTDIISYCESLGCQYVQFDDICIGDLTKRFPFPGVSKAKYLKVSMKDHIESGKFKLDANQVTEVALRLPISITPFYIRALRLEEKYSEANYTLTALEAFSKQEDSFLSPNRNNRRAKFAWITQEKEKIRKTMTEKENGDNCFRSGDYSAAASWYANTLMIDCSQDAGKFGNVFDMETAGGRLHAVLHCNRAACLMALKLYDEAAKECSAALKIEKYYLKAILRRARCYAQMKRFDESVSEYNTWVNYINEYRRNPNVPLRDECRFDRPSNVSESDYQKALNELSEVQKSKEAEEERNKKAAEEAKRRSSNEFNRRQQWQQQYKSSRTFGGKSPNRNNTYSSNRYGFDSQSGYQRSRFDKPSDYGYQRQYENPNPSPSSSTVTCHYQVLQIPVHATDVEIKRAYRKMALKYHPDKNQSDEATDVFRKVKTAYETLSDATLRRNYDFERVRFY